MAGHNYKEGWGAVDATDKPEQFVHFMDAVHSGRDEDPAANEAIARLLQVRAGQRILDVGCGTGGVARAMARLVSSSGAVLGLDNSETMVVEARRRTVGLELPVDYVLGDIHALPFADDSFDGCYALNVFEVVDDPAHALTEMIRVTKRSGWVVIPAPDYGTMVVDASDRLVTRKILYYICDHEVNGWLGRQLPRLFSEQGLVEIVVEPSISMMADYQHFYTLWLQGYTQRAQAMGVVSADEAAAWLAELARSSQEGRFFTALLYFLVAGRKP